MRVVFVENHDSFSWNVIDRLPCGRAEVCVLDAASARPLPACDVLILGPGPLDPLRAGLLDLVWEAALRKLPTLGICLGHQAIGMSFGAKLVRTEPCHGLRDVATFSGSRLFPGVLGRYEVMRYHSLSLTGVTPPLRVVAINGDGLVLAIEHETLPMAGLQFHPDSFATPDGEAMLASFFENVR